MSPSSRLTERSERTATVWRRMLGYGPVSVTMLVAAAVGPMLNRIATPRTVVRSGFGILVVACLWLVAAIEPELDGFSFGTAMALLGIGMGLLAAQLGNVAQSSVVGVGERHVLRTVGERVVVGVDASLGAIDELCGLEVLLAALSHGACPFVSVGVPDLPLRGVGASSIQ